MKILIVKTSSLGDIIQCFPVLNELRRQFPGCQIHWALERHLVQVVDAHPLVDKSIPIPLQNLKKALFSLSAWKDFFRAIKALRREKYRWVFDFQGNCKSGLLTMLSRSQTKIGFSLFSVREWPNILSTTIRFSVPKEMNIRLQNLSLIEQFFKKDSAQIDPGVQFKINSEDWIDSFQRKILHPYLMVCPGSKWKNKQIKEETLALFLHRVAEDIGAHFLLVWGASEEKEYCETIQRSCKNCQILPYRLEIPELQYLMNEMDGVIAVDSSALHLCGTTKTPSFSVFGPTSSHVFKPLGPRHFAFQGTCPYGKTFLKKCPILRSCESGACIRDLSADALFDVFTSWWQSQKENSAANPVSPVDAF
jgi:heptosyltransferase I